MKKYILIIIICVAGLKIYGQLLENKTNLYFGYQTGLFAGNEMFDYRGTISPSFYSNLTQNNGLFIKSIIRISSNTGAGFKLGALRSSGWQNNSYVTYNNSESTIVSLNPVFRINTGFMRTGLYNRLKLFGEISPFIAWSALNIKNNVFFINNSDTEVRRFIITDLIPGIEAEVGCEYAFSNNTGVFLSLSVQEGFVKSPVFLDNNYTFLGINIGVYLNIAKVKRFNY